VAPPAPAVTPPSQKPGALTIVVKKDSVIGIRLDEPLAVQRSRVDDTVTASVSRDVVVDGVTAIASGARLEGTVTLIELASTGREKIGVRFTTLVLADATRVPIQTETIFRESEVVGKPSFDASSVFGAVLPKTSLPPMRGAPVLGPAPAGMPKYKPVRLAEGSSLTVQLLAPLTLVVER